MSKVIIYISCSLDGFIAGESDNLDFLNRVAREGEDYGYQRFYAGVDHVIVGRRTFDKVLELSSGINPHAGKQVWVLSRNPEYFFDGVKTYTGDVQELIHELKSRSEGTIFCDGGSQIVALLLNNQLADELIISVIPIILGSGIRLFSEGLNLANLDLINSSAFESGLVQLHYRMNACLDGKEDSSIPKSVQ